MAETVLITSGPTVEPIDPVRFISNRSSGKMGLALAREAVRRGCRVIFVSGPVCQFPEGVDLIRVETADQMRTAVLARGDEVDVLIMAAAVCDFRPNRVEPAKIKRGGDKLVLDLVPNPDILREYGARKRPDQILVGFALETDHIQENARRKLQQKNLDLIVLNEVSENNPIFGSEQNQVWLVSPDQARELPRLSKGEVARCIWEEIERIERSRERS